MLSSLIVFNFLFQHFLPLGCKRVMRFFSHPAEWAGEQAGGWRGRLFVNLIIRERVNVGASKLHHRYIY